jgi:lipopolysaccharide transport system permease protein
MHEAAAARTARSKPTVRRQAKSGWVAVDFRELWESRELLLFYAVRDIKVRYKQTMLGATWAVLQPVLTMVVLSIFLGRLAGISVPGVPYPVFILCGVLPWQLFSYALTQSSLCLVNDAEVLRKVYFPRLILPIASVIAGLVDFAIAFAVLIVVLLYFGVVPGPAVVALPALMVFALVAALSAGFWLSAVNVRYRDVRYVIPFLAQILMFVTPVAYPATLVKPEWRLVYGLNPMAGVVEGFRWALLDQPPPSLDTLLASIAVTVALFVGGVFYFRRTERDFADLI